MRVAAVLLAGAVVAAAIGWFLWFGADGGAPTAGVQAEPVSDPEGAAPRLAAVPTGDDAGARASRAVAAPEAPADAEALAALRDLRRQLAGAFPPKALRDALDALAARHPESSAEVSKELAALRVEFESKRTSAFSSEANRELVPILSRSIERRLGSRDATVNDLLAWARKELVEEAFLALTHQLQKLDPAVTPEESRAFWEARRSPAAPWERIGYGSGSFLIVPPTQPLPATATIQDAGGGAEVAHLAVPRPSTRDSWWAAADVSTRRDWVLAAFVEKSGLFDVDPARERVECPTCGSAGTISKVTSSGASIKYPCTRCGGAKFDLVVRYR